MKNSPDCNTSTIKYKTFSRNSELSVSKSRVEENIGIQTGLNEVSLSSQDYEIIKPYLKQEKQKIKITVNDKEVKLQLPFNMFSHSITLYISILKKKCFKSADLEECREVLKAAEIFDDQETIKAVISDSLVKLIDKHNCLEILDEYVEKAITIGKSNPNFLSLLEAGFDKASQNIFYLINNQYEKMIEINCETVEAIIERYFENKIFKCREDSAQIINLLMKRRGITNVFELLESERKKSISTFSRILRKKCEPFLVWKVFSESPSSGYYKESEPFSFENVDDFEFVIINYYNTENDTCTVAIKVAEEKADKDFGVNLSLLSVIKIKEINYESKINFNCIMLDIKTNVLLAKIEKFSTFFTSNGLQHSLEFNIEIFFHVSYNFSAILSHITKNFYALSSSPSICKISKNVMSLIIKNRNLEVKSEEEKLQAIRMWRSGREEKENNFGEDIYKSINWTNISLDGLLDFIINDSKLLLYSSDLQKVLVKEFQKRFKNEINSLKEKKVQQSNNDKSAHSSFIEEPAPSFTSELISKLIKIASKYETNQKPLSKSGKLSENNSMIFRNDKSATTPNININSKTEEVKERPYSNNPLNLKKNIKTSSLTDTFFINSGSHHKRNLSNSNAQELLNDTFKQLSNNLSISFSKSLNKTFNISPTNQKLKQTIRPNNYQVESQSHPAKKFVYTTTQTNINSTTNSYLQTENKPNTNQTPTTEKACNNFTKLVKVQSKSKKKPDGKINTSNNHLFTSLNEKLVNASKQSEGKVKPSIDKFKSKLIEFSKGYNTNDLRPKSVSTVGLKIKPEVPLTKKKR